jgi:hypothetical protein
MSLLINFELTANFWKLNPQLLIPKVFAELYKKDKSKDHSNSSQIMWAVAMLVDTSEDNKFRNWNEEDRKSLIKSDYLNDDSFDFSKYQEIIDQYIKLHMSKLEQELMKQETKLDERAIFINDTPYDLETADKLDKLLLNTGKLYDQITFLKDKIKLERDNGTTRGGMVKSATESHLI